MEPIYYREALDWIRAHPIAWLALEAKKLFYLVVPIGPSYTLHSRLYYGASVVSYVSVLALALFAAATRRVAWSRTSGLWLLACSSVLVSLAFFPQERFRIPVLDPALIVLASVSAARPRADREG
jgi:hypothetical protein